MFKVGDIVRVKNTKNVREYEFNYGEYSPVGKKFTVTKKFIDKFKKSGDGAIIWFNNIYMTNFRESDFEKVKPGRPKKETFSKFMDHPSFKSKVSKKVDAKKLHESAAKLREFDKEKETPLDPQKAYINILEWIIINNYTVDERLIEKIKQELHIEE